jgi:hypothetical protein
MTSRSRCLSALLVFAASGIALDAFAADLHVPADHATIQAAVDAAQPGDRILVAGGVYTESVSLLGKSVEIAPASVDAPVVLRGPVNQRALVFASGEQASCVVRGLQLQGALPSGAFGGGIRVQGSSPTIMACTIDGIIWNASLGNWGGAVDIVSGSPVFTGCIFQHNRVIQADGGAVVVQGGNPTFTGCTFRSNGPSQGADLFIVSVSSASATITNSRFEGTSGGGFGARIYNYGQGGGAATVTLRDSVFSGIVQQAISLVHGWDTVSMERVRFEHCAISGYPEFGGPGTLVTQSRSPLTVTSCEFVDNTANILLAIDPVQGGIALVQGTAFCGNNPIGPDFGSTVVDLGGNEVRASCCAGDVTDNGIVNGTDLAAILAAWGSDGSSKFDCDIDNDGIVGGGDLAFVLAGWGACP